MQVLIKQFGNNLGFEIPMVWAEKNNIKQGSSVEVIAENDKLVVLPNKKTLDDMLSQITPDNLHSETQITATVGNEAW